MHAVELFDDLLNFQVFLGKFDFELFDFWVVFEVVHFHWLFTQLEVVADSILGLLLEVLLFQLLEVWVDFAEVLNNGQHLSFCAIELVFQLFC